jgi:hypothetical protein
MGRLPEAVAIRLGRLFDRYLALRLAAATAAFRVGETVLFAPRPRVIVLVKVFQVDGDEVRSLVEWPSRTRRLAGDRPVEAAAGRGLVRRPEVDVRRRARGFATTPARRGASGRASPAFERRDPPAGH